jgi:predicted tellurium resistance membrane protein TerC
VQIALMDMVFSLDSVITAIGMVKPDDLWIMITAIVLAMAVMVLFANPVSEFVDRHPTLKVLALSFLILIGAMLMGEGTGQHIDKGYIYAAMAFALVVEIINLRIRAASEHETGAETSVAIAAAGAEPLAAEPLVEKPPAE